MPSSIDVCIDHAVFRNVLIYFVKRSVIFLLSCLKKMPGSTLHRIRFVLRDRQDRSKAAVDFWTSVHANPDQDSNDSKMNGSLSDSDASDSEQCECCGRLGELIFCDGCNKCWHFCCINPPLSAVPAVEQAWYCALCSYNKIPQKKPKRKADEDPTFVSLVFLAKTKNTTVFDDWMEAVKLESSASGDKRFRRLPDLFQSSGSDRPCSYSLFFLERRMRKPSEEGPTEEVSMYKKWLTSQRLASALLKLSAPMQEPVEDDQGFVFSISF